MSKTVDPNKMVKNWSTGMAQGAQKYKDGIAGTTVNPMALAAAKVADGTYLAAVSDAVNSGRMVAALNAADPAFWKAQAMGAGATAWAAGGQKGLPKYQKKAQALAAAATAASAAAAGATGPLEKVRASINAFKTAFGKTPI